jgi:hypothetical protein
MVARRFVHGRRCPESLHAGADTSPARRTADGPSARVLEQFVSQVQLLEEGSCGSSEVLLPDWVSLR